MAKHMNSVLVLGLGPDKGFIKQEEIPLTTFLATHNGRLYDGKSHGGKLLSKQH